MDYQGTSEGQCSLTLSSRVFDPVPFPHSLAFLFFNSSTLDFEVFVGLSIKPYDTLFKHFFPPGIYSSQNFNQNNLPAGRSEGEKRAGEKGIEGIEGQMASLLENTNSRMNKTFE